MSEEPGKRELRLSQIKLVSAICEAIDEENGGGVEFFSRQFNEIIELCNEMFPRINNIINSPFISATKDSGLAIWKACDEVGLSSMWLAYWICGCNSNWFGGSAPEINYPRDAGDFGRCLKMLEAVKPDAVRSIYSMVGEAGDAWDALLDGWIQLTELYESGDKAACTAMIKEILSNA